MAVPILLDGAPVASINITWPAKRGTDDAVMLRHLGALKHTAREITLAIERAVTVAEERLPQAPFLGANAPVSPATARPGQETRFTG